MTPSKAFLRALIVTQWVLVTGSVGVSLATEALLPPSLRAFVEAQYEADPSMSDAVIGAATLLFVIAGLVATIGLFIFWRPARLMYLIVGIAGLLLSPASGPYVDSGWSMPLIEAADMMFGAILAMVYLSPLKVLYEKHPPAA